jgi:hypothetical protein
MLLQITPHFTPEETEATDRVPGHPQPLEPVNPDSFSRTRSCRPAYFYVVNAQRSRFNK